MAVLNGISREGVKPRGQTAHEPQRVRILQLISCARGIGRVGTDGGSIVCLPVMMGALRGPARPDPAAANERRGSCRPAAA